METTSTLDTDGSGDEANANTSYDEEAFNKGDSQVSTPVNPGSESYENFVRDTEETVAPLAAGDDLTTSQIKTPTNEQTFPPPVDDNSSKFILEDTKVSDNNSVNGNSAVEQSSQIDLRNANSINSNDQNQNSDVSRCEVENISEKLSENHLNDSNHSSALLETASA